MSDAPLTMQQYLDRGYAHDSGLMVAAVDPAADMARAGFTAADMQARAMQLDVVSDRDVISRIQRDFLRRAISQAG